MDAHLLYAYQSTPSSSSTSTAPSGASTPRFGRGTMGSHTAFFYGTLMAPRVLDRVCHGPDLPNSTTRHINAALTIRPALLKGFRRHRVLHADYPGIVPDETGTVRGTVVSGLTDGDIWRLDIFEGDEYERRAVQAHLIVANQDGTSEPAASDLGASVDCETYVWIAGKRQLEDREWDFEEFVREKIGRWVGESAEQEGEYNGTEFEIRPSILGLPQHRLSRQSRSVS